MPTDLDGDATWLGDLALNVRDDDGTDWIVTDNDFFFGSPATTQQVTQRQAAHGGWPSASYLTPRGGNLALTVRAPSEALREQAITALKAAAPLTATTLRVKDAYYDRSVVVRRQGEVLTHRYGTAVDLSLSLIADDPLLYSSTTHTGSCGLPSVTGGLTLPFTLPYSINAVVSSGSIPVGNAGKIDSAPLLRITGPAVTPIVTLQRSDGAVQQLIYQGSLLLGDYLDLDCGPRHTAILNASASRRGLLSVVGGWPAIPPDPDGSSATSTLYFNCASTTGAPTLAASWNDVWE